MNRIKLLLELFPEVHSRLTRLPRTVTCRGQLTLTQIQALRRAFPALDDTSDGVFKIPLPESYSLPQRVTPQDPYEEWKRRIRYRFSNLTPLPSRALWQTVSAEAFTRLLSDLETLPKEEAWTWSGLGSALFNDSKRLRHGALKDWLNLAQKSLSLTVEENPYTACAISFFCGVDTLPRARTLEEVLHMELDILPKKIVSYENAEPFRRATKNATEGDLLLYTEGNPNRAVQLFLQKLPKAIPYQHAGDTDADGFIIASHLFQCHPGTMMLPPSTAPTRPLDSTQRTRAEALLAHAPDITHFPYTAIAQLLKTQTWVEQEAWS